MKKIFTSLAVLATFVGCVKESTPAIENSPATMSVVASIDCEATRVTVEGEKFTDVKWEQGDEITLVSEAGVNVVMQAESAGDSDVRFKGNSSYAAEVDTYYAVYPAVEIAGGVATIDLSAQSGDDAAMLVSTTHEAKQGDIPMSFKPANSLLHVAVSGVESLAKAEFSSFDGSDIASTFSYDFSSDETSMGGSTKSYVVENPAVEGFFFSLPANLDMTNGYIVTLTDGAGNVCSKAYNGKVFERGTTTRVAIEWSQPTVTLATPMTSYSYYAAGDSATANSCANNVIYFNGASTFDNVQKAMVVEAGYIVDGQTHAATLDVANKSFSIGNVTVSSWGSKSVEAYIKTKDGHTFKSAAQTVHITGLPYTLNIAKNDGNWTESGYVNWNTDGGLRLGYYQWGDAAYISTSNFKLPANVNVIVNSTGRVNGTGSWIKVSNTLSINVSGTSVFSKSQKGNSPSDYSSGDKACEMKASNTAVKINSSYNLEQAYALVKSFSIKYGNK